MYWFARVLIFLLLASTSVAAPLATGMCQGRKFALHQFRDGSFEGKYSLAVEGIPGRTTVEVFENIVRLNFDGYPIVRYSSGRYFVKEIRRDEEEYAPDDCYSTFYRVVMKQYRGF